MNETSAKKRSVRKKAEGKRKRDSALTKESILQAATFEFCRNGLAGARVDAIAARAKANMRLLYHYFGDKNGLYLAALEHVYTEIRAAEQQLNLDSLDPATALQELIDFTFTFFQNHQDYIAMINTENLQRGKYLRKSRKIAALTMPLVSNIENILRRGAAAGIFRSGIDPIQLYVTITAFSYFHVSNRHTLSLMFDKDLSDQQWLADRRMHTHDVIATWVTVPGALHRDGRKVASPKLSPVRGKASDLV